jgi:hypothetical protein
VNDKGLSKLYDTLTLDERFRLRVQAWARGDKADMERLDRATVGHQYTAYCSRLEAAGVLTLGVLLELLPKLAKLRMVEAIRPLVAYAEAAAEDAAMTGYLDGYTAAWRAAGKRSEPPDVSDSKLTAAAGRASHLGNHFSEALDRLTVTLAISARTPRDGLAAFCRDELGVSLDDALGAWGRPALAELVEHSEALDAAEPDEQEIELLGRVLRIAWRREGLNDPTAEFDDELKAAIEAAGQSRA